MKTTHKNPKHALKLGGLPTVTLATFVKLFK